MAAGDVYAKTERGKAEVAQRKLKLHPRLRTMLILIEGTQPELLVKEEGRKVGAPDDFLEQLLALHLIERVGQARAPDALAGRTAVSDAKQAAFERLRAAKEFMNVTVVDALGLKSFFFTLKLERASTLDDLRDLVEPYRDAIAKVDEAQADVLTGRLQKLLR